MHEFSINLGCINGREKGGKNSGELNTLAAAMANLEDDESLSEEMRSLYDRCLEETGDEKKLLEKLRNCYEGREKCGKTTGELLTLAAAIANEGDYESLSCDRYLEKAENEDKLLDKLRYFHEITSTLAENKIEKTEKQLGIVPTTINVLECFCNCGRKRTTTHVFPTNQSTRFEQN